jgi:phage antirepressor YoqD-like protein
MNTTITVTNTNNTVTMSSLEIVDFINSQRSASEAELRHDSFMSKVPKVLGEAAPKFIGTAFYTNGTGANVERKVYNFPKREACLMAMSYSYELQAQIFDKMTELEAQLENSTKAFKIPSTLGEALTLAAALEVERETLALVNKEQAEQITANAPLVKFAEDVSGSDDLILIRDLAKILSGNGFKIGQNSLFDKLQAEGYLLQDNKPSQKAMNLGLFKLVESVYKSGNTKHISFTTRVTGKGQIYFVNRYCNIKPQPYLAIVA